MDRAAGAIKRTSSQVHSPKLSKKFKTETANEFLKNSEEQYLKVEKGLKGIVESALHVFELDRLVFL